MNKREIKRLIELLDKNSNLRIAVYNKQIIQLYKSSLDFVRKELDKLFVRLGNTQDFVEASIRFRNIENKLVTELYALNSKVSGKIQNSVLDNYVNNYNAFQSIFNKSIQSSVFFGGINKKSAMANIINPYNWEGAQAKYTTQLLTKIKSSVSVGLVTGQSYPNILKEVTGKLDKKAIIEKLGKDIYKEVKREFDKNASNALRIIKTETHRAESAARLDSIENAQQIGEAIGYKVNKVWSSFVDDRTRQSHIDADGQIADENGMFEVDGELIEAPGFGSAENSINCRCTLVISIEDTKQE